MTASLPSSRVERPSRFPTLRENEILLGTPAPPTGDVSAAVCYPNSYRVGMASLGFQLVWGWFKSHGAYQVERYFDPRPAGRRATPPAGFETGRPLRAARIIAFSLYYEPDYVATYRMLVAGGVRPWAVERGEFDPFVIMGGPAVTANPEPMAPFADAIVLGDGEVSLPRVLDLLADSAGRGRDAVLADVAAIPGVYVPCFYRAVLGPPGGGTRLLAAKEGLPPLLANVIKDLTPHRGVSWIATPHAAFGKAVLIEATRGCPRGCFFCETPRVSPFRRRDAASLWPDLDLATALVKKVGLVGAAVSDYDQLPALLEGLRARGLRITASSLALVSPATPALIAAMGESGTRSIALAPEAATPEGRARYGKPLPAGRMEEYLDVAVRAGIRKVKLYYIIGAPGEEDADARAVGLQLRELARRFKGLALEADVNPLVPKIGTAFETAPLLPRAEYERRLSLVRKAAGGAAVKGGSWREAEFQAQVGRGDRGMARWLARAGERAAGIERP